MDEIFVQLNRRFNTRPPVCRVVDGFQSKRQVTENLFERVILTDRGIGQRPQDRVQSHEKRLREDPRQIYDMALDLSTLHAHVGNARLIAPFCRLIGWHWYLRGWAIHENDHGILPSLEPVIGSASTEPGNETYQASLSPLPSSFLGDLATHSSSLRCIAANHGS